MNVFQIPEQKSIILGLTGDIQYPEIISEQFLLFYSAIFLEI